MNIGNFGDEDDCVPGVMGHKASRHYLESEEALADAADKWPEAAPSKFTGREERTYVYREEEQDVTVNYSFVKRITNKALLLAIHDGNGLYEKWVPKSVVTDISETQIKIKSWFYKRNW